MARTCDYDDRLVFDTWDGIPMCEDCYYESAADATCTKCQTVTGRTERGPLFGDTTFRCTRCSATWI